VVEARFASVTKKNFRSVIETTCRLLSTLLQILTAVPEQATLVYKSCNEKRPDNEDGRTNYETNSTHTEVPYAGQAFQGLYWHCIHSQYQ